MGRVLAQWGIWIVIGIAGTAFCLIALHNHFRFQTYGYDLGIYDQIVWKYAQGMPATSSLYKDIDALGIHFQPVLILLAPLYRAYDHVELLLVIQSIALVVAAYPLYLLAQKKLSSALFSLSIAVAYLLYFGTQRAAFLDFHTDAFFPLLFLTLWYGWETKRLLLFTLGLVGLLTLKEWTAPLTVTLGVVLLLLDRSRWQWALGSIIAGTVTFFIAMYGFIIPRAGATSAVLGYGELGHTPFEVARTLLMRPDQAFYHFVYPQEKLKTLFDSLWPFGPWMVFAPVPLLMALEQFATRFWDLGHPYRWGTILQYSVPLGPILAVATIVGIECSKKLISSFLGPHTYVRMTALVLLALTLLSQLAFHLPILGLTKKELYTTPSWVHDTHAVLSRVPKDAIVTTQNNLAPHLSHRDRLYLLPEIKDAEYVVVDIHPGQSTYNFMTQSESEFRMYVLELIETGTFKVQFQQHDAILLKRV